MEPTPISALQHWLYCPRQCALIHLEREWQENQFTAEGKIVHERADHGEDESRTGLRISRGLSIYSDRFNLSGKCDVVEFHQDGTIFPIEYKRGKPKRHRADEVQLCAQSLCLEEMFDLESATIRLGALFYGKRRRRTEVSINQELRELTVSIIGEVQSMWVKQVTPTARYEEQKCDACSLIGICAPRSMRFQKGVSAWFDRELKAIEDLPCDH